MKQIEAIKLMRLVSEAHGEFFFKQTADLVVAT